MKNSLFLILAVGIVWWITKPNEDEVTLYNAVCQNRIVIKPTLHIENYDFHKYRENLQNCIILPTSSTLYKINPSRSEVYYNSLVGGPRRHVNCAILNSRNWRCEYIDNSGHIAAIDGLGAQEKGEGGFDRAFSLYRWQYWFAQLYWFIFSEGPKGAWLIPDQHPL